MTTETRPVGPKVDPLPPGTLPDKRPLPGRWVRLDPLIAATHGPQLFSAFNGLPQSDDLWTWMAFGPFADEASFMQLVEKQQNAKDAWFYAFVSRTTGKALGVGSFMRADPANGVIEIGSIWMATQLQRTREATEAIYLMIRHAFDDLGVRRLEWKCDALNAPSRRAAKRFGFVEEGTFRQHMLIKGRNRDTTWFSIIDSEWPNLRPRYEAWLADANFDTDGREIAKLRVR